jgi:membrane-associated phospholipid phosphatase
LDFVHGVKLLRNAITRSGTVLYLSVLLMQAVRAQPGPLGPLAEDVPRQQAGNDSLGYLGREEYLPHWYEMITNIPRDIGQYGEMTFTTSTIPAILGMTAVTAILVATDDATWKASDKWYQSSSVVRSVSDVGVWIGDGRPQFGVAAGFALYGFAAGDRRALRTASQTVEAILACGTVVQVLKHLTGRQSPDVSTSPGGVWTLFPNQIEYHKHVPNYDAFPSGHIATTLATTIVIADNYPEVSWIRPVGYTLCGILAVSMANTGIHWYSDYPLGLALGYSFAMLAAHPEGVDVATAGKKNSVKFTIAPRVQSNGAGVQMAVTF